MSQEHEPPGETQPTRSGNVRERSFLPPGTPIGRYVVIETLGHGGMGVLYRVRDESLGRSIALKCPWPDLADNERALQRFEREARSAARLTHPAIVRVYEVFEHDGLPWIAMEWVPGQNLRSALTAGRPPIDRILLWAEQLASGLAHAHAHQVLHRDVNPSNVLIHENGNALLVDFGLARRLPSKASPTPPGDTETEADADATQVSADGAIIGTPRYMSPEQALGSELDERSDIFSLGLVLFETCTGRALLTAERVPEVFEQLESLEVPSIRAANSDVPPQLERIIGRALERDPSRRYASAGELRDDLARLRARLARPRAALRRAVTALLVMTVVFVAFIAVRVNRQAAAGEETIATSLITWPSMELDPRLSPDGDWLSFISDRDARMQVWVHSLDGELEYSLTDSGDAWTHTWSEESDTVAAMVRENDEVRLVLVPAMSGPTRVTFDLTSRMFGARLDRWVGSKIYISGPGWLEAFDLDRRELVPLIGLEPQGRYRSGFSVDPEARRVAYVLAGEADGDFAVWLSNLDGSNARQVSVGGHAVSAPRWAGEGDSIVFTSNRSGQFDLWRADLVRGTEAKITMSPSIEIFGDCATNGSMLVFEQDIDASHLWALEAGAQRAHQLTANARSDFLPAPARDAPVVAFQRAQQRMLGSHTLFATGVSTAGWEDGALGTSQEHVESGYAPELSPDGDWLAYVRDAQLNVRQLATGREFQTTDRLRLVGLEPFPLGWIESAFGWSATGSRIYYSVLDRPEARLEMRSFDGGIISEARTLATTTAPGWIEEVYPSADGSRVAYVFREPGRYDLRIVDVATGEEHVLMTAESPLHPRGWLDEDRLVVLSATASRDYDMVVASPGGKQGRVAAIERAFISTAAYHPRDRRLTVTRSDEQGRHNIWQVDVDSGSGLQLTDNTLPGVTFLRARTAQDGTLLYARVETQSDIWAIKFGDSE